MENSLHEYYSNLKIQPTHASFASVEELEKYNNVRKNVFRKLNIPYTYFKGKDGLELGPDTGENSLIFGWWDVNLTLSEPNVLAHPTINDYFERFNLKQNLVEVKDLSVEKFTDDKKYDFIDAEGFIYTVKPHESWLTQLKQYLNEDGLFIISYYEFYGSFFELLFKTIYRRIVDGGMYPDELSTAQKLFQVKWDTIPHTRKFKSWYFDVVKNPYVRKEFIINNDPFLKAAYKNGYRLYSSFPSLRGGNDLSWIKAQVNIDNEFADIIQTYNEKKLSLFLGRHISNAPVHLNNVLYEFITLTDELIDEFTTEKCKRGIEYIDILISEVKEIPLIDTSEKEGALTILTMYRDVFVGMMGTDQDLIDICCSNKTFLNTWGSPVFYTILSA